MTLQDHLERLDRLRQRMDSEDEFDSAAYMYFEELMDELKIVYELIDRLQVELAEKAEIKIRPQFLMDRDVLGRMKKVLSE
jgi:hypothetical protein